MAHTDDFDIYIYHMAANYTAWRPGKCPKLWGKNPEAASGLDKNYDVNPAANVLFCPEKALFDNAGLSDGCPVSL
jgi:hypothetical protein